MGRSSDPLTLHKYLYANVDPVGNVDPTGNFSLSSLGASINVIGTLTTRAQFVKSAFDIATGEEEFSAKQIGSAIIFNMLGSKAEKVIGLFGKKFSKAFKSAGCSNNSFSSGTLVHTENGLKLIEGIAIGDLVWATKPETSERELKAVTHLIQGEKVYKLYIINFENDESVTATGEHPFFVEDKWVLAENLKIGQYIQSVKGKADIKITKIEVLVRSEKVYNLTVSDWHTFHVGDAGYLVHNANVFCEGNVVAFFPKIKFKGLAQNRNLKGLTGNEIYNAFSQSGYRPSSHTIMRLKDSRTRASGFNTLNDVANIFNKGTKFKSKGGTIGFRYKGMVAIVNPKSMIIVTIKPSR